MADLDKVYKTKFGDIYPLYVSKANKKGWDKEEVNQVISWLTGYSNNDIDNLISENNKSFEDFFREAPELNPNRRLITGLICGIRVEDIKEPLMQEVRYLDKLIDELARGKKLESILRS